MRKSVILFQLQIFDSIIGFPAYMIEKIRGLVGVHYQFQIITVALLCFLSNRHGFLNLDLHKIQSSHLLHSYFLISLYNTRLIQPNRQPFTTLVIILAIIVCFFSSKNSYSLSQKANISRFFSYFSSEIVIIIRSMLALAIKYLTLKQNNKKLVTERSVV